MHERRVLMLRRFVACFALLAPLTLLAGAGCSSAPSTPAPAADQGSADAGDGSSVTFTMSAHVAAGGESFQCRIVSMPDDANGFIVGAQHAYTPGSHHMLLYRTDLTSVPAGMGDTFDCGDETGVMSHVRGIVYGAQQPTGQYTLPDGVGLPYRAGELLLMQVHYLNASASALDAEAHVTLTTQTDGITQRAGVFFFYDPFIHVPAGAKARAQMRCLVPQDVTLLSASAHFHRRGVGYEAYLDPPSGAPAATPFYTTNDWSSPLQAAEHMTLPAGSHVRFGCDYDNTAGASDYYAGPSATNNEMCMFIGLYYPDLGTENDFCLSSGDDFGTGAANCATTTSCLQACPSGASMTFPDVDPCVQKCIADSCSSASGPLFDELDCLQSNCNAECFGGAGSGGDGGAGDCVSCATSKCAQQVGACQAHTCSQ